MLTTLEQLAFEFEAAWPAIEATITRLELPPLDKSSAALAYGSGLLEGKATVDYRLERAERLLRQWLAEAGKPNPRKRKLTREFLGLPET